MNTIWDPDLVAGQGPKYRALAQAILRGIDSGALGVGERLPPTRDLA
jgi:DNA-binding GntR family transcriptional regulator